MGFSARAVDCGGGDVRAADGYSFGTTIGVYRIFSTNHALSSWEGVKDVDAFEACCRPRRAGEVVDDDDYEPELYLIAETKLGAGADHC